MTRTTPPKPVDVEALVPELAAYRRTTTRLHPRPGAPGPGDSSAGGPLLWPAAEPWPTCRGPHTDPFGDPLPAPLAAGGPVPAVPVLQLFARDVGDLPFPPGTDLLQVLWCPLDHEPRYCPRPVLRWRAEATVRAGGLLAPPAPPFAPDHLYVPAPCVLHPERVVEHAF